MCAVIRLLTNVLCYLSVSGKLLVSACRAFISSVVT